jgi:hypothetical protein
VNQNPGSLHRPLRAIRSVFRAIQNWFRRRKFREGETKSQFIARDVRRDVLVVSTERIDEGIITGRIRTTNLLYLSKGLVDPPEFGAPRELRISEIWHWTGQSWGGLPDGTSIVDHLENEPSDRGSN